MEQKQLKKEMTFRGVDVEYVADAFTLSLEATSQCWSEGKKGGDAFQKFGESSSG
jgi:hypothetical protein